MSNGSRKLGDITTDKKLVIKLTNVHPDDGGVDGPRAPEFNRDDVVDEVKERMSDHLSELTKLNTLRIKPGYREVSTQLPNGYPAPLEPSDQIENDSMLRTLGETPQGNDAARAFSSLSDSGILETKVKKGLTIGSAGSIDYIKDVIGDVNARGGESNIAQDVDRAIRENSRFSAGNPYLSVNESPTEENSGTKEFYQQTTKGKNTPRKWPTAEGHNKKPVTIRDLKNMGLQMLLEASGEVAVQKDYNKSFNLDGGMTATLVPGVARLGHRVPYSRFSPGAIMDQVNDTFVRRDDSFLSEGDALSFGSPWNPLVRFNSLTGASARVTVSLLTLTISGMLAALSRVLKNSKHTDELKESFIGLAEYGSLHPATVSRMGSYDGEARFNLGPSGNRSSYQSNDSFLLKTKTENEYTACVERGIQIFFDLPDTVGGAVASSFANPFKDAFESSTTYGYYLTLLRTLIRDASDIIVDGFMGGIGAHAGLDFTTRGSLEVNSRTAEPSIYAGIEATEVFLKRLKGSRLLSFMDLLANLGDLAIIADDSIADSSIGYAHPFDAIGGEDDTIYNGVLQSAIHKKSRLKTGRLSWGSNTIASLYMLPESFEVAEKDITGGSSSIISSTLNSARGFVKSGASGRLKQEDVQRIEEHLDSVYVPFYFQDLRTNEIISFHAFLGSISDSYTANYDSQRGFGRASDIKSYQGTNRAISISFHVVATNPEDFDEMWYKINKFIMMVYPQYTAGRTIVDPNGNRFIQPFSQLVSSSPLVRMRVGDLIKSNISELDIARMFGAGTDSFNFTESSREAFRNQQSETNMDSERMRASEASIKQRMMDMESSDGGLQEQDVIVLQVPMYVTRRNKNNRGRTIGTNRTSVMDTLFLSTNQGRGNSSIEVPRGSKFRVTRVVSQGERKYILRLVGIHAALSEVQDASFQLDLSKTGAIPVYRPDDDYVTREARAKNARVDTLQSESGDHSEQQTFETMKNVTAFFNPEGQNGNPIMRAFNSTAGKGLAGFIENINFDFFNSMWDTDGENTRAPMSMQVDIQFSPIMDINTGLSSDGAMIGAPYNIGEIMKAFHELKIGGKNKKSSITNKVIKDE